MLINATYLCNDLSIEISRFDNEYIVSVNDEKRQRHYKSFSSFSEACIYKKRFINEFIQQVDVELILVETIRAIKEGKQK